MATAAPNPRASLLSGLRTGGVRAASNPLGHGIPHTAAPGGSFNIPRFASSALAQSHFPEEEEDELPEMISQTTYAGHHGMRHHHAPMTAAVDGGSNRFMQQQQALAQQAMQSGMPFNSAYVHAAQAQAQAQAQAMQMQMMQVEIMRLQVRLMLPSSIDARRFCFCLLIDQLHRLSKRSSTRPSS
jgi:hypothetical protein